MLLIASSFVPVALQICWKIVTGCRSPSSNPVPCELRYLVYGPARKILYICNAIANSCKHLDPAEDGREPKPSDIDAEQDLSLHWRALNLPS